MVLFFLLFFTSTIVKLFHRTPLLAGGKCPSTSNIGQSVEHIRWNMVVVHSNRHKDNGGGTVGEKKDVTRAHLAWLCGITLVQGDQTSSFETERRNSLSLSSLIYKLIQYLS